MFPRLLTVLGLLLASSLSNAQPDKAAVKVIKHWYQDDKEGYTTGHHAYGSGVCIFNGKDKDGDDYTIILTNSHVATEECDYDVISYKDGEPRKYRCEWLGATPEDLQEVEGDLALLRCYKKLPIVTLAKKDVPLDEIVTTWGFPKVGRLCQSQGKFLGSSGPAGDKHDYADYMTVPGSSGSGVYYKDELIGVSFAITNLRGRDGRYVFNPDGSNVTVPPAWIVPRKKMEVFLNRRIPKEMGVPYEIGPKPRGVAVLGPVPCEVRPN